MEPSSLIISQMTATSSCCDNLHKSIAASVCPALLNTPPSIACNGNIWPGILKSSFFDAGLDNALIVLYLSSADIPVVTPSPL